VPLAELLAIAVQNGADRELKTSLVHHLNADRDQACLGLRGRERAGEASGPAGGPDGARHDPQAEDHARVVLQGEPAGPVAVSEPDVGGTALALVYGWAIRSRLVPVQEVARILKRHLPGVLAYFRHRVTNAASEGLNSNFQRIKKMAYGFRNTEHFKTAIFFHCRGLDLYPATH
jgi:hypothetical protein